LTEVGAHAVVKNKLGSDRVRVRASNILHSSK
jgi:hypothetical protein